MDELAVERRLAREELVEDDAERPDVGARVDVARRRAAARATCRAASRAAEPVLRRARCPRPASVDASRCRSRAPSRAPCRRRRRVEEEVLGLEIAVHDAERVRLGERLARLEHVVDGLGDRQRCPRSTSSSPRSRPSRYSITMYGAPSASTPTSMTRATCSLVSSAARASRAKRSLATGSLGSAGEQLDRDALPERDVRRDDDDAHAALAESRSTRYLPARTSPATTGVLGALSGDADTATEHIPHARSVAMPRRVGQVYGRGLLRCEPQ